MIRIVVIVIVLLSCTTWATEQTHSVSEEEVFALQKSAQSGDRITIKKLFDLNADGANGVGPRQLPDY